MNKKVMGLVFFVVLLLISHILVAIKIFNLTDELSKLEELSLIHI